MRQKLGFKGRKKKMWNSKGIEKKNKK